MSVTRTSASGETQRVATAPTTVAGTPIDDGPREHPAVDEGVAPVAVGRQQRARDRGRQRGGDRNHRRDAERDEHRRGDGRAPLAEQAAEEPDAGTDEEDHEHRSTQP